MNFAVPADIKTINLCRICITESDTLKSIFNKLDIEEVLEDGVSTLADVLVRITCVTVSISDNFPLQLCSTCVTLVHSAYKFKLKFEQSQKLFQKYIAAHTKQEETWNECDDPKNPNEIFLANDCDTKIYSDEIYIDTNFDNNVYSNNNKEHTDNDFDGKIYPRDIKHEIHERIEWNNEFTVKLNEEDGHSQSDFSAVKEKLHPCPICTNEYPASTLRQHVHTHKAIKRYLSIPNEHKVSPSVQFYHKHDPAKETITIHSKTIKLHKCFFCEIELPALEFTEHVQNHRVQNEYKCDQCSRVFRKVNHLNTHRVKHLKEYPYKCEHCGKGFVIQKNYECHILTHNADELPHECTHCSKRFSNPEHLNRHIIIHTENVTYAVKYRVCKCHHCLKTFTDLDDLNKHECIPIENTSNKSFPCKLCNKEFKKATGLYNHNRNVHKKAPKVLCSVCGNYFSNIYNHMMRHTGEKPFECNQCGKRFTEKPQLTKHLLVHSGLKPYSCSVCEKAFNNRYNLQVHERIHKGDYCHKCTICNKGFLEKSGLKKHMNVHGILPNDK